MLIWNHHIVDQNCWFRCCCFATAAIAAAAAAAAVSLLLIGSIADANAPGVVTDQSTAVAAC